MTIQFYAENSRGNLLYDVKVKVLTLISWLSLDPTNFSSLEISWHHIFLKNGSIISSC